MQDHNLAAERRARLIRFAQAIAAAAKAAVGQPSRHAIALATVSRLAVLATIPAAIAAPAYAKTSPLVAPVL